MAAVSIPWRSMRLGRTAERCFYAATSVKKPVMCVACVTSVGDGRNVPLASGSPSHSRRLFGAVLEAFPDEAAIYVVRHGQTAVGGGLTLDNGPTLEIPWAASLMQYNHCCVNHALYWRILEDAGRAGYEWFCFGRSTKGSGPYRYKKQWGADESTLYWYFLSKHDEDAAAAAVPPLQSFGIASRIWRKLPVWLTRRIGPQVMARVA